MKENSSQGKIIVEEIIPQYILQQAWKNQKQHNKKCCKNFQNKINMKNNNNEILK